MSSTRCKSMKWRVGCGEQVGRSQGSVSCGCTTVLELTSIFIGSNEKNQTVSLTTRKWKDARFAMWKKTRHFKHLFLNFGFKKKSIHHKKK